jgi:hypothetical protein
MAARLEKTVASTRVGTPSPRVQGGQLSTRFLDRSWPKAEGDAALLEELLHTLQADPGDGRCLGQSQFFVGAVPVNGYCEAQVGPILQKMANRRLYGLSLIFVEAGFHQVLNTNGW